MTTRFVLHQAVLAGRSWWFDGNGKITRENGSYERPAPCSFSLVHVDDCPGATRTCRASCYVHGLRRANPGVHECYRQNSRNLRALLAGRDSEVDRTAEAFAAWIESNAPRGFRWHVSGDVVSARHAQFIADAARCSPLVPQWIYTRSFDFVGLLHGPANLVVNLSADRDNYREAMHLHRRYGLRICYMGDGVVPLDLPDDSVIFPDYGARGRALDEPTDHPWWRARSARERRMVCPPDFFGQSERMRCGPCRKCLRHPRAVAWAPDGGPAGPDGGA